MRRAAEKIWNKGFPGLGDLNDYLKQRFIYIRNNAALALIGIVIGVAVGLIEVIFGKGLETVTALRSAHPYYFMPLLGLAGVVIVYVYKHYGKGSEYGMSIVFKTALRLRHYLPLRLVPFAVISTWLTHLFGGSAGREGVAVQIGATLSYNLGRRLRIDDAAQVLIVAGMAAGFAGLFATPVAACFFALEVLKVGHLRYRALLPAFTAASTAAFFSSNFGVEKEAFKLHMSMNINYAEFWKLCLLGLIFGLVGACFSSGLHGAHRFFEAKFGNPYIRILIAGAVLSVCLIAFGCGRYSGSGINLIMLSMSGGEIKAADWLLKAVFTVITLSVGFQGGEVTPLFSIGACLGTVIAPFFGMDPLAVAALGYAAVFAGGTNTLLAPIFIGGEIFGFGNIPYFVIVCTAAFICNGDRSIYANQKISYTR